MVYDTSDYSLTRVFSNVPNTTYMYLEFAKDNFSQLIAMTPNGEVRSFLLKGRVAELPPEREVDPAFFDPEIVDPLKRPLELVPFYEINHQYLNSADAPVND